MHAWVEVRGEPLGLLGDVHGCWEQVTQLFERLGWRDADGRFKPPRGSGLLQVGDLVDRGRPPTMAPLLTRPERATLLGQRIANCGPDPRRVHVPPPSGWGNEPLSLHAVLNNQPRWPADLYTDELHELAAALDGMLTLRLFRQLQLEAEAAGTQVVCLLGNHDVDLLRGGFLYFPRQKQYLLALLGLDPAQIEAQSLGLAARGEDPGLPTRLRGSPELVWLAAQPFLAWGQGLLAVHGGPPRSLVASLDVLGLRNLDDLAAYLEAGRQAGFRHPSLAEGQSLLSPDGADDDAVRDPWLAARLLELVQARTLVVGHSPFLHFPKRRWQQAEDPAVRRKIEVPARLGPAGEVLKLDTNLKRGGPCWLVLQEGFGSGSVTYRAVGADGTRLTLELEPEPATVTATELPAVESTPAAGISDTAGTAPLPPQGVDGDRLQLLLQKLAQLGGSAGLVVSDRLRRSLFRLLYHGMTDLSPVETLGRLALRVESPELARLEELTEAVVARCGELVAQLKALREQAPGPELLFLPLPGACTVAGRLFQLASTAVREALGQAGPVPAPSWPPVVTVSYYGEQGQPWVRISRFASPAAPPSEACRPLTRWPPTREELEQLVRELPAASPPATEPESMATEANPAAPPVEEPPPRPRFKARSGSPVADPRQVRLLHDWIRANPELLGPAAPREYKLYTVLASDGSRKVAPNRFRLRPPAGEEQIVLLLPDGAVVPANTAFQDPAARFLVTWRDSAPEGTTSTMHHGAYLLRYLEGDPVCLFAAVSEEVEALLRLGEVDQLGLPDDRRPHWQQGRYLFTSPDPAISAYFFHKPQLVRFRLPLSRLVSSLAAGLINLNLFLSDQGEPLDERRRFGATDVGLEVVALGSPGIRRLCEYLEQAAT